MRYSGGLTKKEREEIFRLFLNKAKLKFSEIEKALKIRSNKVSYHLEQMQREGLLYKKDNYYFLTKTAERYIPVFQHITGEELSPLPVNLVAVTNKNKILLIKRNKRPYKSYWSLIGGKMRFEEVFADSSLRLAKEKTGLQSKFVSVNSVMHELVEGDGILKHNFILFFTKVKAEQNSFKETEHGQLKWFNIKDLKKEKIIPSDLWLIQNKLNSILEMKKVNMSESQGRLCAFKLS